MHGSRIIHDPIVQEPEATQRGSPPLNLSEHRPFMHVGGRDPIILITFIHLCSSYTFISIV